jgi:hypothetical protein
MKRLTGFFAAIVLAGFTLSACAYTAWFYDTTRDGEGIILTEIGEDRMAFAFFTHASNEDVTGHTYCDSGNLWFTGATDNFDGTVATGDLKYDVPVASYPDADGDDVSHSVVVGTFTATRAGTGWDMSFESNGVLCDVSVFDRDFEFRTLLVE